MRIYTTKDIKHITNILGVINVDEYLVEVEMDNGIHTLKTFSNSVEGAVDNMVQLEGVNKLFNILNLKTNKDWEFSGEIKKLREIRNMLPKSVEIIFEIQEG